MTLFELYLPFCVYGDSDPDFSESDQAAADSLLLAQQSLIVDCVDGLVDGDYCLDYLQSKGLNPDKYVEAVASNFDWLTDL